MGVQYRELFVFHSVMHSKSLTWAQLKVIYAIALSAVPPLWAAIAINASGAATKPLVQLMPESSLPKMPDVPGRSGCARQELLSGLLSPCLQRSAH
jgi:hypothetical protein